MNLMVLSSMIPRSQFNITTADSGIAALDVVEKLHKEGGDAALPTVILMDVMMPGMDGIEATSQIRQRYPRASTSIIMVSAKMTEDAIQQAFKSGCNDYLTKPIKVRIGWIAK